MGAGKMKPWERIQESQQAAPTAGPWQHFQQASNAAAKGDLQERPMLPATILPFAKDPYSGEVEFAVPGIVQDAISAARLPADVASGRVNVMGPDGNVNPDIVGRSLDLAITGCV